MAEREQCYIAPAVLHRWVIAKAGAPGLAWSGSRWVGHRSGIPELDGVQVSNFPSKMQAFRAADEAGFTVRTDGYCADRQSITCYACGMTSYNLNDVIHKWCGNCNVSHEEI